MLYILCIKQPALLLTGSPLTPHRKNLAAPLPKHSAVRSPASYLKSPPRPAPLFSSARWRSFRFTSLAFNFPEFIFPTARTDLPRGIGTGTDRSTQNAFLQSPSAGESAPLAPRLGRSSVLTRTDVNALAFARGSHSIYVDLYRRLGSAPAAGTEGGCTRLQR